MSSGDEQYMKYWACDISTIVREAQSLVHELGHFDPIYFMELNYHLLRGDGFSTAALRELCKLLPENICKNCIWKLKRGKCLLMDKLRNLALRAHLERAPPCVRAAFRKNKITVVASYLIAACLIDDVMGAYKLTCDNMRKMGFCEPDEVCKVFKPKNVLQYSSFRLIYKVNRFNEHEEHNPSSML
ncbi:MAG: hypothetical protein ACTSXJ_06275 [Candidatus Baldrarchaeia archaeon]